MPEIDFEVRLDSFEMLAGNSELDGDNEPYLLVVRVKVDNVLVPSGGGMPSLSLVVQALGNQGNLGAASDGIEAGAGASGVPIAVGRWRDTLRIPAQIPPVMCSDVEPATLAALVVVALEEDNLTADHVEAGRAELEAFVREKLQGLISGGMPALADLSPKALANTIATWKAEAIERLTGAVTDAVMQIWKFTPVTLPVLFHEANVDDFVGVGLAGPINFTQLRQQHGGPMPFTLVINNPDDNQGTFRLQGTVRTRALREQDPIRVAAVARGQRLDVIARDDDHKLYRSKWNGESWTPWNALGAGTFISGPAAAQRGPKILDLVALGEDRHYYYGVYDGSGEPAWGMIAPAWFNYSDPALVARATAELVIIGLSDDRRYVTSTRNPLAGTWSSWKHIGQGKFVTGPSACVRANGHIAVFGVGDDRRVWWNSSDGDGWSGWKAIGAGTLTGAPAVIATGDQIDLFGRGDDRQMYRATYSGGAWSDWKASVSPESKATFYSAPAVTSRAAGTFDLFALGDDRNMFHNYFDGSKWHGWMRDTPARAFL
jgi:hypothetical protein